MGDGRLNYLIMLYINKDTPLDYTAMTDRYAAKRPRRMLLVNPLQETEEQITDYDNLKFVRFLLYLTSHAMLVLQLIDKHLKRHVNEVIWLQFVPCRLCPLRSGPGSAPVKNCEALTVCSLQHGSDSTLHCINPLELQLLFSLLVLEVKRLCVQYFMSTSCPV